MLLKILRGNIYHQRKSTGLTFLSIVMGSAITAAFMGFQMDVAGRMARELRSFGANILIEPANEASYLSEKELFKIKTIFWRHNILAFAPLLHGLVTATNIQQREQVRALLTGTWFGKELPGTGLKTGICCFAAGWKVEGGWLKDGERGVMIGSSLARRLGLKNGDELELEFNGNKLISRVTGRITTGGAEEDIIFVNLAIAQQLLALPGKVSQVLVSALTVPPDQLARKDPGSMSRAEYERWYCTPYVTSVAHQLEGIWKDAKAKPIWRVAEAEGKILNRIKLVIIILSALVIFTAATAVAATMTTVVLNRRQEIGLMKALGASKYQLGNIFFMEAVILGLIGGIVGYFISLGVAYLIGVLVFDTPIGITRIIFFLAVGGAMIVSLVGALLPLKRALRIEPSIILKGV